MRIVVCIKHVPDVQSERRIEDGRLVRGEEDVLNELDENAVEAAVCLAEEADGEVIYTCADMRVGLFGGVVASTEA